MPPPFHLAIPVHDLAAARGFYGGVLDCPEGRASDRWVDFDFFGHQLVAQLCDDGAPAPAGVNEVDGHDVPVPHFGVVLDPAAFDRVAERLRGAGIRFRIAPCVRFAGRPGEQQTMFFDDPSGNVLEVKAFRDAGRLFAP